MNRPILSSFSRIFDHPIQVNYQQMNQFGEKVRALRERKGLLLRQAAAFLEVDTAFISKVERGQKRASREQAYKLALFLKINEDQLLPLWLADRIFETIQEDPFAAEALDIVKEKIACNA